MVKGQPHFLLFTSAEAGRQSGGRWHFALESINGRAIMEASDAEPGVRAERLELLAVVRGLEALDQPSRVTLVTSSRRVSRGFRFGLEQWRHNRWRWERDGRWVPIKNRDLWQRVDRALQFHSVECRTWRFDQAHGNAAHVPAPHDGLPLAHPAHGRIAPVTNRNAPGHAVAWAEPPRRAAGSQEDVAPLRQRMAAAVRSWFSFPMPNSQWSSVSSLSS